MPTDDEVVSTAADAAEAVIFERYRTTEVVDFDVTVRFEGGVLDVDVYLNVDDENVDVVADEAALAAQHAVDTLFDN